MLGRLFFFPISDFFFAELLVLSCVWALFGLGLLLRSKYVLKERLRVLDVLYAAAKEDGWVSLEQRKKDFYEIDSDTMVFQFWKPVSSFYKGRLCMMPPLRELSLTGKTEVSKT